VLAVALVLMGIKLRVAATTGGVDDVWLFSQFADYVHRANPIMVYGVGMGPILPYNHPPLTGYMLDVFWWLSHNGRALPETAQAIPHPVGPPPTMLFAFLIRLPATLMDVVTSVLVFELVRMRRSLRQATVAGLVVALSPVLFIISGYHGNTDPVFIGCTLLSLYLLTLRRWPETTAAAAGVAYATGLGFKIVPIVVLPLLLLIAARSGRRRLVAFLVGSAFVMLLVWWPVVLLNWGPFKQNVLGYAGVNQHQWGLIQFGNGLGVPHGWLTFWEGPGRFVIVLVSALLPLLLAWRRPDLSVPAVGLTLMIFLLFNPATSTQYMAWAAAPMLLSEVWTGLAFNVAAGVFLFDTYDSWNGQPPWRWLPGIAWATIWNRNQVIEAGVAWAVLLVAVVLGFLLYRTPAPLPARDPVEPGASRDDQEPDMVAAVAAPLNTIAVNVRSA
jgi:4-amino-4-deoxy-L-arabinose transferase-like glycosyltransferase